MNLRNKYTMEKFKVIILLAHPNIQDSQANKALIENIKEQMYIGENAYDFENEKSVILMIDTIILMM